MTKPFIPYARVSSDEQKDAETIKTQIAEVNRHARADLPLADWILDEGVSGMIPFHERPGGARVLELLRSGNYAGLVCLNHKRIGRDAYVIHLAVRQIEQELRLDIQAVREPVPSQLAPGARALMRAVYAGVAQHDREEDLAQMRAGKVRAAKEGRYNGGAVPFGLKLSIERIAGRKKPVKRLVVDETCAPVVLEIFTLYAEGNSQERVAETLKARGAKHPTGDEWKQSTVSYMLRNPFYMGAGVWRRRYEATNSRGGRSKYNLPPGEVVHYEDYQVPAIVPPELWERCALLRDENMRLAPRNSRRLYLLRGLVRCGECDRSLTGVCQKHGGREYLYYRCTSRADRSVPNCALRDVKGEELERLVWSGVVSLATSPGGLVSKLRAAMSGTAAAASGRSLSRDAQRQLEAKGRERERVITWARQGRISEEELDAQLAGLAQEVAGLEAESKRLESSHVGLEEARARLADAESFLGELAVRVHTLTREEMAAVVRRAVPRVVVSPREDGRKVVAATYRLVAPVTLGTGPPPESF
jgi:site-specific DNA recombinase